MIAYRISASEKDLDLGEQHVLALTKKSPLMLDGKFGEVPGLYSIPVNIPATDHNRAQLQQPEYLNNWKACSEHDASVHIDGNFLDRGYLRISAAQPEAYRIQFFAGAGDLVEWKTKTLRAFEMGGVRNFTDLDSHRLATRQQRDSYDHLVFKFMRYDVEQNTYEVYNTVGFYALDLLGYMAEETGYRLVLEGFEEGKLKNLLIFHPVILSDLATSITPELFLPNLTAANFLKEISKIGLLGVDVDSRLKVIRIFQHRHIAEAGIQAAEDWSSRVAGDFVKSVNDSKLPESVGFKYSDEPLMGEANQGVLEKKLKASVVSVNDLPTPAEEGDWCYVLEDQGYYRYFDNAWDTAHLLKYYPIQKISDREVGGEGAKVDIHLAPALIWASKAGELMPVTGKTALSTSDIVTGTATNAYAAFYVGEGTDFANAPYPIVGTEPTDLDGNAYTSVPFRLNGGSSIYGVFWESWLQLAEKFDFVEVDLQPSYADLFNFSALKLYKLWDDHSGAYHYFYIDEYKITVADGEVKVATCKMVQWKA